MSSQAPLSAGLRALRFAEALQGRYRAVRSGGRQAALVLRQWPAFQKSVFAALTAQVFVAQHTSPAAAAPAGRPIVLATPQMASGRDPSAALVYRERVERIHETVVRLEGRGQRLEPGAHQPASSRPFAGQADRPKTDLPNTPGERLVLQTSPAAQARFASASEAVSPTAAHASSAMPGRPADAQAPLDVERLADQVVSAIDRRIVARRERTGRL